MKKELGTTPGRKIIHDLYAYRSGTPSEPFGMEKIINSKFDPIRHRLVIKLSRRT